MILDDDARVYVTATVTIDADPDGSTAVLIVGATPIPLTWTGPATMGAGPIWVRSAITTSLIAGPSAATHPTIPTVSLPAGRVAAETRVTLPDGQIVVSRATTLTVEAPAEEG